MNNLLKSFKLKSTKHRILILSIIKKSEAPITAEEIYFLCQGKYNISLSTIYRNLNKLCESGIIMKNKSMDGQNYFQLKSEHHHHKIVCSVCKKNITVKTCPLNKLIKSFEKETGFIIKEHNLEFIDICPECQNKNGNL